MTDPDRARIRHPRRVATVAILAATAVAATLVLPRVDRHRHAGPVTGGLTPYASLRDDPAALEKYDYCLLLAALTHAPPTAATACQTGLGYGPPPAARGDEAQCPAYRVLTTVATTRAGTRTWRWDAFPGIKPGSVCSVRTVDGGPQGRSPEPEVVGATFVTQPFGAGARRTWILMYGTVPADVARLDFTVDGGPVTSTTPHVLPGFETMFFQQERFFGVALQVGYTRIRIDETRYDARGRRIGPPQPQFFRAERSPAPPGR